jgi:phospholipase/lecithinase/hemolysin
MLFVAVFSVAAFGQADFTVMVTFGNSLTHNDLLWIYYGNPPALYSADPMEAVFDKGAEGGDVLTNYAVAGSETGDIATQIDLYEYLRILGSQDKATLICLEVGGNDIMNDIDILAAYAPGEDPVADAIINNMLGNMRDDLIFLRSTHTDAQFIVWTIPDVTLTPGLWYDLTPSEAENVREHTERINKQIRIAGNRFSWIVTLDVYTINQLVVENPPVIFGHQLVPPPSYGDFDHLFADEVHPTAVSNALIANITIGQINRDWNDNIPRYTQEELADLAHIPY